MIAEKEMTAPVPSAATEAGQPFDMNSEVSIAKAPPSGKNFTRRRRVDFCMCCLGRRDI